MNWLEARLAELAIPPTQSPGGLDVRFELCPPEEHPWQENPAPHSTDATLQEAYTLRIQSDEIRLRASSAVGLFRASVTLSQLLRCAQFSAPESACRLPCQTIEDAPHFEHRGLMLDISRDRVPLPEELVELLNRCASLKINHVELYGEHTFPYSGHESVWRKADVPPLEEWSRLSELADSLHIDLVPNQQTFGHMHRWLKHPEYAHLAEVRTGVEHAFSYDREPFSLCPTHPGSIALVEDLLGQLLPVLPSPFVNVGCDETFDLGLGQSREACEARGSRAVYTEFLLKVHDVVRSHGRRMLFWGDILLERSEDLPRLPPTAIPLLWGYEANHPFDEQAARLARCSDEFWICPGTSSWQCMTGRWTNMKGNLLAAAHAGVAHGASGFLVTDWGDFGHWQPAAIAWPGYTAGACLAWNPSDDLEQLEQQLDLHGLPKETGPLAEILHRLGTLPEVTGAHCPNASPWFMYLRRPEDGAHPRGVHNANAEGFLRCAEQAAFISEELLHRASPCAPELAGAAALTAWACRFAALRIQAGENISDLAPKERSALVGELNELIKAQATLWLRTSRPGGCQDSIDRLKRLGTWIQGGGQAPL